jgi:leucyl-tRNA synthetase
VQINGKLRGEVLILRDEEEESVKSKVFSDENIKKYISGQIKKFIYVPNRIINIII